MNEQYPREAKLEAGDLAERSSFIRWLDNFWYHHKWAVIISVFFAVVLIIGLVQIFNRTEYDAVISIVVAATPDEGQVNEMEDLFSGICPADITGNGKKEVYIYHRQVYSTDEYREEKASLEAESIPFDLNSKYNSDELSNFEQYLMSGECVVCMVSPFVYDRLRSSSRLQPLSYVYGDGDLPAGAMQDGCGIALKNSDLYEYNEALSGFLPDTTILCLLKPVIAGKAHDPAVYGQYVAFFRALADYRLSE